MKPWLVEGIPDLCIPAGLFVLQRSLKGSQCLLAVEVHFRQAGYMETIEFDGFITYSEGLSSENRCYVSPVSITGTSTSFSSPNNMFGWSRASYSSVSADSFLPMSLQHSLGMWFL